jgi:hypothetical protein
VFDGGGFLRCLIGPDGSIWRSIDFGWSWKVFRFPIRAKELNIQSVKNPFTVIVVISGHYAYRCQVRAMVVFGVVSARSKCYSPLESAQLR